MLPCSNNQGLIGGTSVAVYPGNVGDRYSRTAVNLSSVPAFSTRQENGWLLYVSFLLASNNPASHAGIHVATLRVSGTNRFIWYTEGIEGTTDGVMG